MTPDEQEARRAAFDTYRDAVAILRATIEDDREAFTVIVQHCNQVAVIHGLATMLMGSLWQLGDEDLDNVFARIEGMQRGLRKDGGNPA